MIRPGELVRGGHAPDVALRLMEHAGLSSLFVLDRDGHLLGLITADTAVEGRRNGVGAIRDLPLQEVAMTAPDAPLRDLRNWEEIIL